jgi:hypothetical protein
MADLTTPRVAAALPTLGVMDRAPLTRRWSVDEHASRPRRCVLRRRSVLTREGALATLILHEHFRNIYSRQNDGELRGTFGESEAAPAGVGVLPDVVAHGERIQNDPDGECGWVGKILCQSPRGWSKNTTEHSMTRMRAFEPARAPTGTASFRVPQQIVTQAVGGWAGARCAHHEDASLDKDFDVAVRLAVQALGRRRILLWNKSDAHCRQPVW